MNRKILRWAVCLLAALLLCMPVCAKEPAISAKSAVVLDGQTGRVLVDHRAGEPALPASTTKIMTALLILEDCQLDDRVVIPAEAAAVEGSSMGLKAGEVCTVEALLYGLMLHSGNDAAVALAIHHSGSIGAFTARMNRRAGELGLPHTHFANPHGLDAEGHVTTALELARLAAHAMEHPEFAKIVATKSMTVDGRTMTNHNRLLWSFPGAVGVKTGYTKAAGRTLVSAARRDGRLLLAVTMDDGNDWQDHSALLEYGFSAFTPVTLARSGQVLGHVPVLGGEAQAQAVLHETICLPLGAEEQVRLELALPPVVFAPVQAGEQAGEVAVVVDGTELERYPLYWKDTVER